MKSILACCSALLLTIGACNKDASVQRLPDLQSRQQIDSSAETASWRTYTNTEAGFEFRYPDNWREANTVIDKAKIVWVNFSSSSAGATRNVLYVKIFPDRQAYSLEERLIASNATATQVTVDKTTQTLYGDFLDTPTAMISNNDMVVEIGDPSHEAHLKQILATFRFRK
jgi:hypothetical protein